MSTLFLSHSTKDDDFVRRLQQALADLGQEVWIDSRQLKGGDPLWTEIAKAIDESAAYAVLVTPGALQSKWVGKELRHALGLQQERGREKFPVVPLSLDGTQLGVLEVFFDEEPIYIAVSSGAGGVEAALDAILVALGKRLPADLAPTPQPPAEPLEELVLELTDLEIREEDGKRRASARARLVHEPAAAGQPPVRSHQYWRFVFPLGPIEAGELRWYLEQYAIWPSGIEVIRERARRVEGNLVAWGRELLAAAMPAAHAANVLQAWARIDAHAGRRFSVYVDATLEAGAPEEDVEKAREAATQLLGLPWELLHDGEAFLFQGGKPTRVRRRLPNTRALDVPVLAPPIRILLVTARPEDEHCGYIDHRASALPLVEAMEELGGRVRLRVLNPPTLPALRKELERAGREGEPYHVVHFDGHGVYEPHVGLGGLCFEHPEDGARLKGRRHAIVYTDELGPLLKDYRIPLVFLEACQSATAEKASESVAAGLLKMGMVSVVAMSHSVLVETSRRFVAAFYAALAGGARVGAAMLEGQRRLKDDNRRGRVFGAEELRLEDWFVPVLYQEKDDPQLFRAIPPRQAQADGRKLLAARLGELPPPPETGFVGRSRELLALERLLCAQGREAARYAVLRGQGGEGKTALAAEFARWLVRSQQISRAAFVSVETHSHAAAVLDALGRQLAGPGYSVATFADPEQAILPVERALLEQSTLLVVDNMESILPPPYLAAETPEALAEDARRELDAILGLCARLNAQGETRLVFTSREALPAPFAGERQRRELERLETGDAVRLVERVLDAAGGAAAVQAAREEIEQLVEDVHRHARTLALLAPALKSQGVAKTRVALAGLMAEMERKFPGNRERSVFASVELSLRRLSDANRERVGVLGVFHGGVDLDMLHAMMQWEKADIAALADELIQTGLATADPYDHLTLNPALCPYLRGRMERAEREALTVRWAEVMGGYAGFLDQQQHRSAKVAAALTMLELPNLFAFLDHVQGAGEAAATIGLSTLLYSLLQNAGKPRLLERVAQVRDAAAAALGEAWNHANFLAERTRIEQQLAGGELGEALTGAQTLLGRARAAGEWAYLYADYDLATACNLAALMLRTAGEADRALPLLDEARRRFEAIADAHPGSSAEGMVSNCITDQGDCLLRLGRLDEAAAAYEEGTRRNEERGAERNIAVGKGQLGTVRLHQRRYPEALAAYSEAREQFMRLNEPGGVATSWHQTGRVYQEAGQPEAAEDAYRKALAIKVQLGNAAGQASTLLQLGILYDYSFNRPEEAVVFYRQAADKYIASDDVAKEGHARSNLGATLRKLGRLDEARQEIQRAIICLEQFGHAAEPWTTWSNLAAIETDAGQPAAAAEARAKAIASYLAHRRDGGENHHPDGRIALAVTQPLLAGEQAAAATFLGQLAADPDLPDWMRPFLHALQSIAAGSRDRRLADSPELDHTMAAEILFLIETLEPAAPPAGGT